VDNCDVLPIALRGKPPLLLRPLRSGKVDGMNTPNQLSRQAIEDFRAIYQDEFGNRLSDDEIQEIATRLLRFFGILVEPENPSDQNSCPQRSR
jgi:hypothetical protein